MPAKSIFSWLFFLVLLLRYLLKAELVSYREVASTTQTGDAITGGTKTTTVETKTATSISTEDLGDNMTARGTVNVVATNGAPVTYAVTTDVTRSPNVAMNEDQLDALDDYLTLLAGAVDTIKTGLAFV